MPDMKKFLDQEGLSLLWRKIEAELKTRDDSISNFSASVGTVETKLDNYKTSNDTAVQANASNIASVSSRVTDIEAELNSAEVFEPISDTNIDALFA